MPQVILYANRVRDPLREMTGVGRYIVNLVQALADGPGSGTGWSLAVSAPPETDPPEWLPPPVRYRPLSGRRALINAGWTLVGRPWLEDRVGDFDLVHVTHPSFPVPTRRRAVVTVHDLMPVQNPQWYSRPIARAFGRTLRAVQRSDGPVIAVSGYVAGQLSEWAGVDAARIAVVQEGVGEEFARPVAVGAQEAWCGRWGLRRGGFVVAVGNVSTRKNLVTVVRALARCGVEDLVLVLAGRAHDSSAAVQAEVERLGLGDRVRRLGFVADGELPVLLQAARGLVHPSVDEGFGFPPLEAMAGGTPALVSAAGSLPEIVGEAGVLLDPLDVDGWAGALSRLAGDDDWCSALAAAGRVRAEGFSWARAAAETLAVYERALI